MHVNNIFLHSRKIDSIYKTVEKLKKEFSIFIRIPETDKYLSRFIPLSKCYELSKADIFKTSN